MVKVWVLMIYSLNLFKDAHHKEQPNRHLQDKRQKALETTTRPEIRNLQIEQSKIWNQRMSQKLKIYTIGFKDPKYRRMPQKAEPVTGGKETIENSSIPLPPRVFLNCTGKRGAHEGG